MILTTLSVNSYITPTNLNEHRIVFKPVGDINDKPKSCFYHEEGAQKTLWKEKQKERRNNNRRQVSKMYRKEKHSGT